MRVVTNDNKISTYKQRAQVLFFLSIAGLIGSFFLVNAIQDPDAAVTIQCLLMPVLLLMVITSVRMTNLWVRQPYPWQVLQESLKGVGNEYVLYNYLLPANHVLIGPNGIFAITTRFQEQPQKVVNDKWRRSAGLLTLMRQEQIGNPTAEAKLKAAQTEAFLKELLGLEEITVIPLLVFVNPRSQVDVEGESSVPILYAGDKKKPNIKNYMKEQKKADYPTLTAEQIAVLDDVLLFQDD